MKKISEIFIWKFSFFGDENLIYLNRRVFVMWGSTHRRAIEEWSKALNHNLDNNHACGLPQNIHVTACLYTVSDNLTSIFRHCTVPRMLRRICLTLELAPHKRPERNQQHRTINGGFRILSGPLGRWNHSDIICKCRQSTPVISTSLISNNRSSRSENLVPV